MKLGRKEQTPEMSVHNQEELMKNLQGPIHEEEESANNLDTLAQTRESQWRTPQYREYMLTDLFKIEPIPK